MRHAKKRSCTAAACFLGALLSVVSGCGTTLIGALGAIGASGGGGGGGAAPGASDDPPVAIITDAPEEIGFDRVEISYRLVNDDEEPVDIVVEVSLDGGAFVKATEIADGSSEGVSGLSASKAGESHTFVWNSFADTGPENHVAVIRITPKEVEPDEVLTGDSVESASFAVANAYTASVFDALSGFEFEELTLPDGVNAVFGAGGELEALLVSDIVQHRVIRIDQSSGAVTTIAGTGEPGFNGDNRPADEARLSTPMGIAVGPDGAVYIADSGNQRVRRVDPVTGFITTVAGGGSGGSGQDDGDGGLATEARLEQPVAVRLDDAGNLYVADAGTDRIRVVNRQTDTIDVGLDLSGDVICVQPATIETVLRLGAAIKRSPVGGVGNVFNNADVRIADFFLSGTAVTLSASVDCTQLTQSGASLDLFIAESQVGGVFEWRSDGTFDAVAGLPTSATNEPRVGALGGVGFYPGDNALLFTSTNLHVIWSKSLTPVLGQLPPSFVRVGTEGMSGFAGDGGPPEAALLRAPRKLLALSGKRSGGALGNVVVFAEGFNRALRAVNLGAEAVTITGVPIAPQTIETLLIGESDTSQLSVPAGVAVAADGKVYMADAQGGRIFEFDPATGVAKEITTGLLEPIGIALAPNGAQLTVAEGGKHRVVAIDLTSGNVSVIAGTGVPTDDASQLGDGGPATAATLNRPIDVVYAADGTLFVSDSGNARIRRVDAATGTIETFVNAATDNGKPLGGFDPNDPTLLAEPGGLAIDEGAGRLIVADAGNHRLLAVDLTPNFVPVTISDVTVIAGADDGSEPLAGYNGDHRAALGAWLDAPSCVAVDGAGTVLFCDTENHRIRTLTGDVYNGNGIIETACGTGQATFNGEPLPPVNTAVNAPSGIALDPASGAVYFADTGNFRLRRFKPGP